jgi:hypothetical protein
MRTAGDIPLGREMPAAGEHPCLISAATRGESKNKHTPYVELTISNGETEFTDSLFISGAALPRLMIVALRVCGMPKDYELPDDDYECAEAVADYIKDYAPGKHCIVTVGELKEKYMATTGPDAGRTITKTIRKVTFGGYAAPTEESIAQSPSMEAGVNEDSLPF